MAIVLLALAVHGPLLLLQLPANSYDANTHIFFAAHYAKSWFNPWNENWFAGFSQTTYPPLTHQWIALFSHLMGLTMAYMVVQLIVVLLLTVGVYRYSRLWVNERAGKLCRNCLDFSRIAGDAGVPVGPVADDNGGGVDAHRASLFLQLEPAGSSYRTSQKAWFSV